MNTYPTRLFILNTRPDMPDQFRICLYFHVRLVDLLTVNTMCNIEWG